MPGGFLILDFETTGLSPKADRIIEVGLIRTNESGVPIGFWSSLVNPGGPVEASHVHGITDSDVSGAPTFKDLADELLQMIKGQVLVGHNFAFDRAFLSVELARVGWRLPEVPSVCTMNEGRHFLPGLARYRLLDCAEAVGIPASGRHRALEDASTTTTLFNFYLNGPINKQRAKELLGLPATAQSISWPTTKSEMPLVSTGSVGRRHRERKIPLSLLKHVSSLIPEDLLGDLANEHELSYAELLLGSLEDGSISEEELAALSDCAESFQLSPEVVSKIHRELLLAIAREAWRDGVVSRSEREEISSCAARLSLRQSHVDRCLQEIEEIRSARMAARSKSLPEGWNLGEPLRYGDRIVFTGCYDVGRTELEEKARKSGLRVTGSVSGRTALLVSDGTIKGNKDADAARLGVRVVGPEDFRKYVDYVQPAGNPPETSGSPVTHQTASLVCVTCGSTFQRIATRGRKPHNCEKCRS